MGLGSTKIPVQLCFNSKRRVFESVSKSSAPASMKKPSFNCENNELIIKWGFSYYLSFEENLVNVCRLPILAPRVDLLHRDREVVGQGGRRPQVVFGKCIAQKFCILLKAVQVRPRKDAVMGYFPWF